MATVINKRVFQILGTILITGLFSLKSQAQLLNSFDIHHQVQQKGSIVFVSNSSVSCGASCSATTSQPPPTGTNNGTTTSSYIDIDGNATTFMSSSDSLNLPNCSEISWAGLYWGGEINGATDYSRRDSVKLKVNSGTYLNLKADSLMDYVGGTFITYHCFKNITSIVKANGIKARYTLANVAARTGTTNKFGGWTIVVVYKNDLMDMRNLTVFSGLANVATGANSTVDIPINGFLTPPSGPVSFELGMVIYDGDRGAAGDSLLFKGGAAFVPISNTINPTNDVFNSTISYNGVLTPFRNPSFNNTLGYDADIFVPNNTAKNFIGNNATSATIRQRTGSETFLTQVVTSAIDVYEPDMRVVNQVIDINGGLVQAGDTLEYTLIAKNQGSDISINTIVFDTLNYNIDFVPGSLNIVSGPNAGIKTDGVDSDQAEYNPITRKILFRIGTGANGSTGGSVINSATGIDSTVVKFKVRATTECVKLMCDNQIPNRAYMQGTGKVSGNYLIGASNPNGVDAFGCPSQGSTTTAIQTGTCTATTISSSTPSCVGDTIRLYAPFATNAIYSWTGPSGYTSNVQNPKIGNATAVMAGTYTVVISFSGVTCTQSASTTVAIIPASVGGTAAYSGGVFCNSTNSGTITLSGHTGSVVKWQTSTNGGTSWTDISNTTASNPFTNAANNQQYRAVVNNGTSCSDAFSSIITITVNAPSVGGTTSYSGSAFCSSTNSGTITLSGQTGSVLKWQTSTNGGTTWTDIANTTASYTFNNAVNNQKYSVVVNNGTSCSDAFSSVTTITVNAPSVGGSTSTAPGTLCSVSNSGSITLSGHTGSVVKWQTSTNGGVTWTDIANTLTTYNFNNAANNQQYRAVVNNGVSCSDAFSSATTITTSPASCSCLTASVGGTTSYSGGALCSASNSGSITLSGNTGSVVKWQTSTNGGSTWTDITSTSTSYPFTNAVNNQQYRAVVNNGVSCSDAFSSAVIISTAVAVCVEICNDGIDNDGNGLTDCDDPVCKPIAKSPFRRN